MAVHTHLSTPLSVTFEPVVDEEPNGEIGDATEVKPGESVAAYIFPVSGRGLLQDVPE